MLLPLRIRPDVYHTSDILMSDRCLPSCPFLLSYWFFFCFFTFFPCIKYHELVWFAYRWRNFVRMQYYFSYSSLLILVMFPITSYGLRLSLSSLLMLWQKALFLLLQKDLRVRDFISWFSCIHFKIWVHSSLFNYGDNVSDHGVFDTLPFVLMSLLLDLVSPLDIPYKKV